MDSAAKSLDMSLYLNSSLSEYAGNMSCVTLQRELFALCSNESMAHAEECNTSAQGINLAVPIVMTAFGVCGNILALLVLYSSRREAQARRTVFFVMLSGLAWTDLICQLAVSPIAIIVYANQLRWVGGVPLCHYHGFMMVSFGMVMPLIICCMSLERLLAIKFSYCYTRRVTRRKALMTFLACWGITLAFTVLPFIGLGSYELQYPGSWCFLNFHKESLVDTIYAGIFSSINIIAILTMIVSNLTVAGTLCRMRLSRRLSNSPSLDRKLSLSGQFTPSSTTCGPGTVIRMKRHSDMEAQMIWFLGLITVSFSVCWLPLNVHILLMQFTGYTDCVLDLKVIRMASCNQILDPWLYVIFRKNSILRIARRIKACFRPKKEPTRAQMPHRMHHMMNNRSFTVDGTTYGRTGGMACKKVCKHLILGGADLIGEGDRGNGFIGAKLSGSNSAADLLCSQCSFCDDYSDYTGRDPLINLRLGSSPTFPRASGDRFTFDSSSRSDIEEEEDSTHETDLLSDRRKSDITSEKQKSPDKKAETGTKLPLVDPKAESMPSAPKLRWFLPGLNSGAGDAFASYESTETSSFPRQPSVKSPHPIYKQKIHLSRSLLDNMTPGFSPAEFRKGQSGAQQSAFTFPSPESLYDLAQNKEGGENQNLARTQTVAAGHHRTANLEGVKSPSTNGTAGEGNRTKIPDTRASPARPSSPARLSLSSSQDITHSTISHRDADRNKNHNSQRQSESNDRKATSSSKFKTNKAPESQNVQQNNTKRDIYPKHNKPFKQTVSSLDTSQENTPLLSSSDIPCEPSSPLHIDLNNGTVSSALHPNDNNGTAIPNKHAQTFGDFKPYKQTNEHNGIQRNCERALKSRSFSDNEEATAGGSCGSREDGCGNGNKASSNRAGAANNGVAKSCHSGLDVKADSGIIPKTNGFKRAAGHKKMA